jgi:hypothetical protein
MEAFFRCEEVTPVLHEIHWGIKFLVSDSATFLINCNNRKFVSMETSTTFVDILLLSCLVDHVLKQNRIAYLVPVEI